MEKFFAMTLNPAIGCKHNDLNSFIVLDENQANSEICNSNLESEQHKRNKAKAKLSSCVKGK